MASDLSEAEIAALRDGSRSLPSCEYDWQEDLIAEVRRRRRLTEITEEEREALRWLRATSWHEHIDALNQVLDKLLSQRGDG